MKTLLSALAWIAANPDTACGILLAALSVLSGVLRALGKVTAAKWCGTFSIDVGRGVEWIKNNPVLAKRIATLGIAKPASKTLALLALFISVTTVNCGPKAQPVTALDAAKTAIILTDDALTVGITASSDDDAPRLIALVPYVEAAARAVRDGQDACPSLPSLAIVATELRCDRCVVAIDFAKKELSCPQP